MKPRKFITTRVRRDRPIPGQMHRNPAPETDCSCSTETSTADCIDPKLLLPSVARTKDGHYTGAKGRQGAGSHHGGLAKDA